MEHRGKERRIDRVDVLHSLDTKMGTVATLGGLGPVTPVPVEVASPTGVDSTGHRPPGSSTARVITYTPLGVQSQTLWYNR